MLCSTPVFGLLIYFYSYTNCKLLTVLSESFVHWGKQMSVYRLTASIAVDITAQMIESFLIHP